MSESRTNIDIAAQLWTLPKHAHKEMDVDLAMSIVGELDAKDAELTEAKRRIGELEAIFMDNLRAALDAPDGWISVEERLPEPGMQVAALRSNGTWDQASCNPIYFEGLAAWYLPEGPTPCGSWQDAGLYVTHWMPLPEPPKNREGAE